MGVPLKKVVEHYIGLAKQADDPRMVYRGAATDLARAAMDPANKLASLQLSKAAMEFAAAARRPPTTSDFLDLLRETEAAVHEVGGDPMNVIARRREIHEARSSDAPRVSIAPESFNEDVTLGRSGSFKWNPTNEEIQNGIKQSDTVAFWQGFKREAQAMTIDIGFLNPPAVTPEDTADGQTFDCRPYAIVEYGSDGDRKSIQLDVGFGVRLTVVGNYISVLLGMNQPRAGFITTTLGMGASIGAFAAPSQAPVTSTTYIDALAAGNITPYLPRPLKGQLLLTPLTDLALAETLDIFFYSVGGGANPIGQIRYTQATTTPQGPFPFPIPGDVAWFQVRNNGVAARNIRLPFQLSL